MAPDPSQHRTVWFLVAALVLAALSYLSFLAFVHSYCENRPIMLMLAAGQLISSYDFGHTHGRAES
jgi:hypothetical protein